MNKQTNVQVTAFATGVAVIVIWLLGYFVPDLMAEAPKGLEAALTGMIVFLLGLVMKPDAEFKNLGKGNASRSLAAMAAITLPFIAGCSSNPVKEAETPEQQAYALYGSYVIAVEQAADLVEDPDTPAAVKASIKQYEPVATQAAVTLRNAVRSAAQAREAVAAGESTRERLTLAIAQLNDKLAAAGASIRAFVNLVENATS